MWTPRKGSKLGLSVTLARGKFAWGEDAARIRKILDGLGLPKKDQTGVQFTLPSKKVAGVLDALEAAVEASGLELRWFVNEPAAEAGADSWYTVSGAEGDCARKLRSGFHFGFVRFDQASSYSYADVASDRFVEVVKREKLTGLEVLPLPPHEGKRQDGWWEVFAREPIGRGLDHPAADSAELDRQQAKEKRTSPARRWGHDRVYAKEMEPARIGDAVILRLAKRWEGMAQRGRRFVREHLPSADFAYTSWGWDNEKKATDHCRRSLLCSPRAREILVKAGVLRAQDLDPVEIVAAADADQVILDRTVEGPIPRATLRPEAVEPERARREKLNAALAKPGGGKPKAPSLAEVIATLEELWRSPAEEWGKDGPGRDDAETVRGLEKARGVPEAWKRVARVLPMAMRAAGGEVECWRTGPPTKVTMYLDHEGPEEERPSAKDVEIGSTEYGDWFAVRSSDPAMPGDAAVRLWDHETGTIKQEWGSVAEFAGYLVEVMNGGEEA